jgi:hypothetical protein
MTRLLGCFLLVSTMGFTPSVQAADALWDQVQNARRDGSLAPISAQAQHKARLLFRDLAREAAAGEISAHSRSRASGIGLHLRVEESRVLLWGRQEPHGLFVFRLGDAEEILLQAPHSFYDLGTGAIVAKLFERLPIRGAFFNSAHRYGGPGIAEEERPDPLPDLAHQAHSLFQAATLGSTEAVDSMRVVQIHGFATREGEAAVLTTGSALQPGHIEQALRTQLSGLFLELGPVVSAAARPELSGRKNVQGQVLSGRSPFLHLELSKATRDHLLEEPKILEDLGRLLLEVKP